MGEVTIHIRGDSETGRQVEIEVAHDDLTSHDWSEKPPLDAPKEIQLAFIGIDAMRRATPEKRAHCPKCQSNQVLAASNRFECVTCGLKLNSEESTDEPAE